MKTLIKFIAQFRIPVIMLLDSVLLFLSFLLSRLLFPKSTFEYKDIIHSLLIAVFIYLTSFASRRMYKNLWKYAHTKDFLQCYLVSMVAGCIFVGYNLLFIEIPFDFLLTVSIFSSLFLTGERVLYGLLRTVSLQRRAEPSEKKKVLLVGAGQAAITLIEELRNNPKSGMSIVCAVDDSQKKIGCWINGIEIAGSTENIPELCSKYQPDMVVVAIPSIDAYNKKRILSICADVDCEVKIMEDVCTIMLHGGTLSEKIREISLNDLLGRETIRFDDAAELSYISDKTVMVTGGGGSIGSELCRQIAMLNPKKLIIVEIYENNAYDLQQELLRQYTDEFELSVEICSVRDLTKLDMLFREERPDIVFHAAAHKHVPLMEKNPDEAVKNNVIGTYNTAFCADKYGVERFILISTDKAVNPTNFMGASKRCAEMVIQRMAFNSKTKFAAVRFGNVIGSNGSVIPLFKKQIESGGPVTVTHPQMVRYFMTIPEASQLVIKAGSLAEGGEIFVLDMGEPVRILELAENMIRLVGLRPYKDIDIIFTGLRPGEKLYEELLLKHEEYTRTENNKIYVAKPVVERLEGIFEHIRELSVAAESNDVGKLYRIMSETVPSYTPWTIVHDTKRCV